MMTKYKSLQACLDAVAQELNCDVSDLRPIEGPYCGIGIDYWYSGPARNSPAVWVHEHNGEFLWATVVEAVAA